MPPPAPPGVRRVDEGHARPALAPRRRGSTRRTLVSTTLRRRVGAAARSPASRIVLLPDLPGAAESLAGIRVRQWCPSFVPGHSGGGRAGLAPASEGPD